MEARGADGRERVFDSRGAGVAVKFDGFVFSAWLVVALNAAGGLLVAAAMRYADNVLKTLAASLSIVVSTIAATIFLSAPGAFIKVRGRGPGGRSARSTCARRRKSSWRRGRRRWRRHEFFVARVKI